MAIPARFERATFRLGGGPSILLRYGTMLSKVLIFQGFREFGDCSPWRLECLFLIRKGRFLISFSNFGGRTFSHMLISTLLSKGVGVTGKPGHFRTLFPFSVSGKAVVGLLLRRRPLYPTELRNHIFQILLLQKIFDLFGHPPLRKKPMPRASASDCKRQLRLSQIVYHLPCQPSLIYYTIFSR